MRKRTAYTSFMLALTCCCSTAHAAKNVEVVRYPSLFMFGGIGQSVGVSFSYSEHKTENSSSSGTALRETYSLGTSAAVLDPHLLALQLMGGISYSQNFGGVSTKLLNGEYNIQGSAFDMSYHPIVIGSSRSTAIISNGYTPSYSMTNNTHQISASLMNSKFPLQGYYAYSTSESSGLEDETSGTSSSLGFSVQHHLERSDTRFSFSHGKAEAEGASSASYSAQFSNNLDLDRAQNYRLNSNASISETSAGSVPQRDISLSESLSMRFGKAFTGSLSEGFSSSTSEDFEGNEQSTRSNMISAALSHTLYQSLSTSVAGSYSEGSSFGGDTSSYGGSLRVAYRKILPAQSLVTVNVDRSMAVQSQHQINASISDTETVFGVTQDQVIPPPAILGRITVLRVISFAPLATNPELPDPAVPVLIYDEGIDYEVDASGAVRIVLGGRIETGSNIEISYAILANQDIEIRMDTTTTSASLALLGGRYSISGSYGMQSQELVSGEADSQGLVDSRNLYLMASAFLRPTLMGLEYARQSSTQETNSRISAYASHTLQTDRGEAISFNIRDTYSMVESDEQGNSGGSQNNLSISATYNRKIYRWVNFALSLGGADSRGDGRSSDFLTVRATASGAYNQLQFSLSGQTLYRIAGSGTTRDSNLSASITRFF